MDPSLSAKFSSASTNITARPQVSNSSIIRDDAESQVSSRGSRISKGNSCTICLSSLINPASLTCGHKFCERCLELYWQTRDKPSFIICPLCRTYSYDIMYTTKEDSDLLEPPDTEFRLAFSGVANTAKVEPNNSLLLCLKLTLLILPLYYLICWMKSHYSMLSDNISAFRTM